MASDPVKSEHHLFPELPYDEVESGFIRDEIRRGRFDDLDHRSYVNDLVQVEWFTTWGPSSGATGISQAATHAWHWRIAAKYPKAFDTVRREFGESTRAELTWGQIGDVDEDEDALERWERQHRWEWNHVATDSHAPFVPPDDWLPIDERPRFLPYRFPAYPYDGVRAPFIVAEIRRGSFADLEYRRYVNRLIYIEAFTRDPGRVEGTGYPPVTPWRIAAAHPLAFDAVRRELDATTRAELATVRSGRPAEEISELEAQHAAEWRRVGERE